MKERLVNALVALWMELVGMTAAQVEETVQHVVDHWWEKLGDLHDNQVKDFAWDIYDALTNGIEANEAEYLLRAMEAKAEWRMLARLILEDQGYIEKPNRGHVYAEWTGTYPTLCSGAWFLFVDGKNVSDKIPEELRYSEMNTYRSYGEPQPDGEDIWYTCGLGWKKWRKANLYWLREITRNPKIQKEIYHAIHKWDWCHHECGGCL